MFCSFSENIWIGELTEEFQQSAYQGCNISIRDWNLTVAKCRGRVPVDEWCNRETWHLLKSIKRAGTKSNIHSCYQAIVIEMKLVTTTTATVKKDPQFVSCETERSVQTASCLEAGSNLTTKNWPNYQKLTADFSSCSRLSGALEFWRDELRGGCQESCHHLLLVCINIWVPQHLKFTQGTHIRQLGS